MIFALFFILLKGKYGCNNCLSIAPMGKRGWKMFRASLRELILYLHKDEHGFNCGTTFDDTSNAIRIHHSLAMDASDYGKRHDVFRLRSADWSEYLFQARCTTRNLVLTSLDHFIHSGCFYSASSSPPLLRGAPNFSIDTVSELTC